MTRIAISIILNGLHHLKNQLYYCPFKQEFQGISNFDQWIFVEGASKNTHCTSWCNQINDTYHKDGHSVDGTLEYLRDLEANPLLKDKIKVVTTDGLWDGKVSMFNAGIAHLNQPCWLWQIDIDEYWRPEQLAHAESIVDRLECDGAAFACDYLLTDDIIVRGEWGESTQHGYRRLFKYTPGSQFIAHEPPVLQGVKKIVPPYLLPRFKHLSYYYEQDVVFKSKWYGDHENIHKGWQAIVSGAQPLPCYVENLFMKKVSDAWKNTIITYR